MPRTQRQKSLGGSFAVSPWMGREDYHPASREPGELSSLHRVVECDSLLVGSLGESANGDDVQQQDVECIAPEEDDHIPRHSRLYFCPPELKGVQCVICFSFDGSLVARAGGDGNSIGISGKVFDTSGIDCTMDSASYVVLLRLNSTDSSDVHPVWVLAESSGGDAMCLKSPIADPSQQDVLGSLAIDGMVELQLDFQCDTIVNCEDVEIEMVQSQLSDAIQDHNMLPWALGECTTSSHINIGTLTLSSGR